MLRPLGVCLGALLIAGATGWSALALYIDGPGGEALRAGLAGVGVLGCLAALVAFVAGWRRRTALLAFIGAFAALLAWWTSIPPSNDRDWQPEVARLASATIAGDLVTVHNIRNFDYRTETDFTPAWETRTFDLRKLEGVDLVAVYWMGPAIAHLFLSFDFGGDHLAISVEARKERTEGYSSLRGFFKQYELVYVVGDERDLIRLRTNYRKDPPEDVYLFRLRGRPDNARRLFLDYVRRINELHERPAFYNTVTANCTNVILLHARVNPGHLRYSWKVLLSGYAPEYAYENGRLDTTLPFPELMRRSHINAAAQAADTGPDFSRRIRVDLPASGPPGGRP